MVAGPPPGRLGTVEEIPASKSAAMISQGSSPPASANLNGIAWILALSGAWLWTWKQLSLTWSAFPNWEFGYLVPWIALLLAFRKVTDHPGCLESASEMRSADTLLTRVGLILALALFFLAELVRQFDPHWRMVNWTMTASVILLTTMALWRRGRGKLLAILAFPLAFVGTAVPWPVGLENLVTLKLRALVTHASVWTLHASGIDAAQRGHLIDLPGGTVEIDAACSGINSLQISLMASLFLGEFFRLNLRRRFLAVAGGSILALVFNALRATTLVLLAQRGGHSLLAAWHDWIGYAESAAIFAALVFLAWAMSQRKDPRPETVVAAALSGRRFRFAFWPGREGVIVLTALALLPPFTAIWFTFSPGGPIRNQEDPLWNLRSRPASAGWSISPVQLSPTNLIALDCSDGQTLRLKSPSDMNAWVYRFFWKTDATANFPHSPDMCMVASGWEWLGESVEANLQAGHSALPGRFYRFTREGKAMVVFQSIWYGGTPLRSPAEIANAGGGPRIDRLALLWKEPRRRGLEVLSVYLPFAGDLPAQIQATEEILAQTLVQRPETGS